jgi:hypothetical protein
MRRTVGARVHWWQPSRASRGVCATPESCLPPSPPGHWFPAAPPVHPERGFSRSCSRRPSPAVCRGFILPRRASPSEFLRRSPARPSAGHYCLGSRPLRGLTGSVHLPRGIQPRFVPPSGFLNLSAACSASGCAGLLHPATTSRVRRGNRRRLIPAARHECGVHRPCHPAGGEEDCMRPLRSRKPWTSKRPAGRTLLPDQVLARLLGASPSVAFPDACLAWKCCLSRNLRATFRSGQRPSQGGCLSNAVPVPPPATPSAAPVYVLRQCLAQGGQPTSVSCGVSKVEEQRIPVMRCPNGLGMFDWAPVLFGPRSDLADIGDNTVGITAEIAMDLFDAVQICELVSIQDDVAAPRHLCHPVDRKADRLICPDPHIEQREREKQGVDGASRRLRRLPPNM